MKVQKSIAGENQLLGIIYLSLAGVVILIPLLIFKNFEPVSIVFGAFMLIYGIYKINLGIKINKNDEPI